MLLTGQTAIKYLTVYWEKGEEEELYETAE